MRIFINCLTLLGFKKNYTVPFKNGLNYISGPTSTGKSTIAELINYALGAEKHKDYIEVRQNCSDVELELEIGEKKFKIRRPLFDFNRPVKLFRYSEAEHRFSDEFELLPIESPSNEESLSRFLLNQLGFIDIKVVNQTFSFRDIYKYCYLRQNEIDNEDIMKEKSWGPSIKRKPTFEIIFNIFDSYLSELRAKIKEQSELIDDLGKKKDGVSDFLKNLKMLDIEDYYNRKVALEEQISLKRDLLYGVKSEAKNTVGFPGNELEEEMLQQRQQIDTYTMQILEQTQYVEKLVLLRNQYQSELGKIEFLLEGAISLNRYSFQICPSCLNDLKTHESGCELCGSQMKSLSAEEQKVYKSEMVRLKLKFKKLTIFIEEQNKKIQEFKQQKKEKLSDLLENENKLNHIRNAYISPRIANIERLNLELGELGSQLKDLDRALKVIRDFNGLITKYANEIDILSNLKKRAKEVEESNIDKQTVLENVSTVFGEVLEKFKFPKLSNANIGSKDYLPYVRGRKYDNIGSLGSVTMITMAYYLSLLIVGTKDKNAHPGLLIIDTPRKNLGADPKKDEEQFKDEKIYNSIIQFFIDLDLDIGNNVQLIIINNGYPDFLSKDYISVEYDGDGTKGLPYGLIDDAEPDHLT